EGALTRRDEVMAFLRGLMQVIYRAIRYDAGLADDEQERVERAVSEAATGAYAHFGWLMEPIAFSANGTNGESRRIRWARGVCELAAEAHNRGLVDNGEGEKREEAGETGVQPGGGGNRRARAKRNRTADSALV